MSRGPRRALAIGPLRVAVGHEDATIWCSVSLGDLGAYLEAARYDLRRAASCGWTYSDRELHAHVTTGPVGLSASIGVG